MDTSQCIKPALSVIGDAVSEGKTHEWSLLFITLNQADELEAPLPSGLMQHPTSQMPEGTSLETVLSKEESLEETHAQKDHLLFHKV